jgi:cytochrome c7-like protein
MIHRTRTAKRLGTRHDLNYFKHWSLRRRWLVGINVAVLLVAGVWLLASVPGGRHAAFSPGPVSHAHAFIGNNCSTCHSVVIAGIRLASFNGKVSDSACLSCHQAPTHHPNMAFTPGCASCHAEHTAKVLLKQVAAGNCLQCHQDKLGKFIAVGLFPRNHPEFKALRDNARDPGTVALNHATHLKSIRGPGGVMVQLECSDCHRAVEEPASEWKYGSKNPPEPTGAKPHKGLMTQVTYERACAGCHLLQFDHRMMDQVPHKDTQTVRAALESAYRAYLTAKPGAMHEVTGPARLIPARMNEAPPKSAANANEWVAMQVQGAEALLYKMTCRQCHTIDFSKADQNKGLPAIAPSNITAVWMPHAHFEHSAHAAIACASCHSKTEKSANTSDVLVPDKATCGTCHSGSPTVAGNAENGCFECHGYHDWTQKKAFKGTMRIDQLTGKTVQ